ncbi:MAG: cupin domain-containing protein [Faecalibacillus sp.]
MKNYIKNFPIEKVTELIGEVEVRKGEVVSKTLVQNNAVSMTLFAFDKDEEIGEHDSSGDAMVNVLEGVGIFTVGGKRYEVKAGESLIMPARIPHSLYAKESFKMLLIVIFPNGEL